MIINLLAIIGGFVLFCLFFSLLWKLICKIDKIDSNNFIVRITTEISTIVQFCLKSIVILIKKACYVAKDIFSAEPKSWRENPASQKQKDFADDLGITYDSKISKGMLSDLISEKTGK